MSNTQNDVQLGVGMDATGVERSAAAIEIRVEAMAGKVAQSGQKAGQGVEAIAAGGDKAAREMDRTERSISASLQRRAAALEAAGKGERAYHEARIRNRGLDPAVFKADLDHLEAVERAHKRATGTLDSMGMSAKATSAALRGVPAQFTDIVTALQGGQAPLTVFMQQGGQLKDMFGGAGNAAKALGGYVLGLINPLTVAAAAMGALAYGYAAGSKEAEEFQRTLIMTGGAAGVTAGQLQDMSAALARIGGGTQSKAAEVLNAMAEAGIRGATNLQRFAGAAIELERAGGPAAEKTARAFAELANEPLKAALKLNDAQHFLTQSTYQQIKALEEQGRTVEAARVAQEAYAGALEQRTPQMVAQLGLVERAWQKITDAGKGARDGLLNVGRDNTMGDAIAALEKRIAANNRDLESASGFRAEAIAKGNEKLKERLGILQQAAGMEALSAGYQAENARQVDRRRAADVELLNLQDKKTRGAEEERRVRAVLVAAGETEKNIAIAIAAVRKKFASNEGNRELEAQADLLAKLSGLTSSYNNDVERLNALRKSGKLSEEQYTRAVQELVALQPYMVRYTKDLTDAERARNKGLEDANKERDRYLEGVNKSIEGAAKETQSLQDQLVEMALGKEALNERIALRLEEQAAAADSAARWTAVTEAEADAYRKLAQQLRDAAKARRDLAQGQAEKAMGDANARATEKALSEWEKTSDQIGQALADALMQGGDSAAEYIKRLFRTMVLKPIIQGAVQPVANSVLGLLGYSQPQGAGGVAGTAGALQTGSNLVNVGSSIGSAYGWATSSGLGLSAANYAGTAYANWAGTGIDGLLATNGAYGTAAGTTAAGSGTTAASTSGMSWGFYAAMAAAIYAQGSKDYANGFDRDAALRTGGFAGRGTYYASELLSSLGVNDKIADIFGATAVAAIIGRANPRITATGITGTFGGGDFMGSAYDHYYEKGGWLRSSKSYDIAKAVPDDVGRFLDEASKSILEQAQQFGAALGLPAEQLASVTKSISLEFNNGNTPEEIKAALMGALEGYGNALVEGWAATIAPLKTYGETTEQTINRVGAAIGRTNEVLNLLGKTALQASVDGGRAAMDLEALFGGTDGFRQAAGQYMQDFYSEAERAALATNQLGQELARLGINTVPATRDAYRAMVDAQDLTTTAGRETYAALLQLAPAFASVVAATADLGDASNQTAQDIANAAAKMAEAGQKAKDSLAADRTGLEVNLLRSSGRTAEADQLQRATDLAALTGGVSGADQALITSAYDYNQALKQQIALLDAAAAAQEETARLAAAVASERTGLEQQLLQAQGDTTALRQLELAALDPSNRALQERLYALQDAATADQALATQAAAASQALAAVAGERLGLEQRLLQAQGNTAELRRRELEALDPANRALQEQIYALDDLAAAEQRAAQAAADAAQAEQAAAQASAQAAAAVASERLALEQRLLQAQGNTAELRRRELEALDPANRALQEQIHALEDLATAEQRAAQATAEAAQAAAAVASQRLGLEQRLLQLQGNTAELRRRELEALDPSNRMLQEQIYAMEDMSQAQAAANAAQQEAAQAAEQLKQAWQSVTDGIFGEVERIRTAMGGGSSATLAQSQSQFAIATAQARAGSQDAAKTLPALSQAMLSLAESQAGSYFEVQRLRGQTAASLERTGTEIAGRMGLVVPTALGGSATGWDSQQGSTLIADQVQQLRDENRAQALAVADLQARLLKLMERWETDGMPTTRSST